MDKTGRVQAIDRVAEIMKLFTENRTELKLTEISEELELSKSTVHGLINTLKYHGFIDQDERTQKYRLGVYLMRLGDLVYGSINIIGIARPYIVDICNKVEETVHLGTLDGMEVVYIDKIESTQSMRISTARGARNPAYCTGVGKAMLAYMDVKTLDNLLAPKLDRYTPNTITEKDDLLKELQVAKENGYAFDNEENNVGLFCIAAPIFNHQGHANYGISVSGPSVRMTEEKRNMTIKLLKEACMDISRKIGYRG